MVGARAAGSIVAVILLVGLLDAATQAQGMGRWKIWRGDGTASATLYSINTLTTGTRTIDYHPALVVSCEAGRYPVWRQELLVRRMISGQYRVDVTMRFDNGGSFVEQWMLSDMNRSLQQRWQPSHSAPGTGTPLPCRVAIRGLFRRRRSDLRRCRAQGHAGRTGESLRHRCSVGRAGSEHKSNKMTNYNENIWLTRIVK